MSAPAPAWGRYIELRPEQLAAIRLAEPMAYIPWGALDWHGPHLPFGVDGLIAEAMAEQLVQRTGGVLFPTTWWPGTVVPHQQTLAIRKNVLYDLLSDLFDRLAAAEWHMVVLMSGYYAREHELALLQAAEEAMVRHGLLVLALPPLALIDDSLLDHAGLWETSLILSLRPDLVDLYALGEDDTLQLSQAVRGRDPRGAASASLGDTVQHLAVERIIKAIEELRTSGDPAPLYALYEQRRERYQHMD